MGINLNVEALRGDVRGMMGRLDQVEQRSYDHGRRIQTSLERSSDLEGKLREAEAKISELEYQVRQLNERVIALEEKP